MRSDNTPAGSEQDPRHPDNEKDLCMHCERTEIEDYAVKLMVDKYGEDWDEGEELNEWGFTKHQMEYFDIINEFHSQCLTCYRDRCADIMSED